MHPCNYEAIHTLTTTEENTGCERWCSQSQSKAHNRDNVNINTKTDSWNEKQYS